MEMVANVPELTQLVSGGQGLDPGSLAPESTFFPSSLGGCLFPV